jgi:hypothetical protein
MVPLALRFHADPDAALLEHEIQLACTHTLLTCLDHEHRIAYILGLASSVRTGPDVCDFGPTRISFR